MKSGIISSIGQFLLLCLATLVWAASVHDLQSKALILACQQCWRLHRCPKLMRPGRLISGHPESHANLWLSVTHHCDPVRTVLLFTMLFDHGRPRIFNVASVVPFSRFLRSWIELKPQLQYSPIKSIATARSQLKPADSFQWSDLHSDVTFICLIRGSFVVCSFNLKSSSANTQHKSRWKILHC